jgi:hypothetical protein
MEIRVNTIWVNGFQRVGIPEKYVVEALKTKEELILKGKIGEMSLPNKVIKDRIKGYSEWFKDKFGRGQYRLAYFDWQPKTEEEIARDEYYRFLS